MLRDLNAPYKWIFLITATFIFITKNQKKQSFAYIRGVRALGTKYWGSKVILLLNFAFHYSNSQISSRKLFKNASDLMRNNGKLPQLFTHLPNTSDGIIFQKQLIRVYQTNDFSGRSQGIKGP